MESDSIVSVSSVGPCGIDVMALRPHTLVTELLVRTVGAYISSHEDELKASDGLFLGGWYDPMSDEFSEATGLVFSMCQSMGIPVTVLCSDMSWASGYSGYAAMLGVRRDLVWFGCSWDWAWGVAEKSDRLHALCDLSEAGFPVWVRLVQSEAFDKIMYKALQSDLLSLCKCGVHVCVEVSDPVVFNAELWHHLLDGVSLALSVEAGALPVYFDSVGGASMDAVVLGDSPSCSVVYADGLAHLSSRFAGVDKSRVVAGDLDAMVTDAAEVAQTVAHDHYVAMEKQMSRRERRAAQRQLAKDRQKASK